MYINIEINLPNDSEPKVLKDLLIKSYQYDYSINLLDKFVRSKQLKKISELIIHGAVLPNLIFIFYKQDVFLLGVHIESSEEKFEYQSFYNNIEKFLNSLIKIIGNHKKIENYSAKLLDNDGMSTCVTLGKQTFINFIKKHIIVAAILPIIAAIIALLISRQYLFKPGIQDSLCANVCYSFSYLLVVGLVEYYIHRSENIFKVNYKSGN
jgi:hypothetical protein